MHATIKGCHQHPNKYRANMQAIMLVDRQVTMCTYIIRNAFDMHMTLQATDPEDHVSAHAGNMQTAMHAIMQVTMQTTMQQAYK